MEKKIDFYKNKEKEIARSYNFNESNDTNLTANVDYFKLAKELLRKYAIFNYVEITAALDKKDGDYTALRITCFYNETNFTVSFYTFNKVIFNYQNVCELIDIELNKIK